MFRSGLSVALLGGMLMLAPTSAFARTDPWSAPMGDAELNEVTALGLGASDKIQSLLTDKGADFLGLSLLNLVNISALVGLGGEPGEERQDGFQIFMPSGRAGMSLSRGDASGNISHIEQHGVIDLPAGPMPAMGIIAQAAGHTFPGGSQSAVNAVVAVTISGLARFPGS